VDVNLLIQAEISQELIAPKDFASDKKVEQLLSFDTMERVCNSVDFGVATSTMKDYVAFLLTFMFSKLHLHAVNAINVPSKHRAYYLCISMMFFVTIEGIHPTSRRNMVLESICNIFLCLRSDIKKVRYCTSELCEHMFGNIRQERREFTCSDFSNVVDKQNRRIKLNFQSNIKVSDEQLSGYQESFAEFLQSAMTSEEYNGPCDVDLESSVPVSSQLWPFVKKVFHKTIEDLENIYELLDVKNRQRPTLLRKPDTLRDLMEQIIAYCPKSFTYEDLTGLAAEDDGLDQDDNDNNDVEEEDARIVSNIKNFAVDILSMEKQEAPSNDTNSSLEKESVLSENDGKRHSTLFFYLHFHYFIFINIQV